MNIGLNIEVFSLCFYRYGTPNSIRYFALERLGLSSLFKYTNIEPSVTYLLGPKSKYDDDPVAFLVE